MRRLPNPGSEAAARNGCMCPVHANNDGNKTPKSGWVVNKQCIIHGELVAMIVTPDGSMPRLSKRELNPYIWNRAWASFKEWRTVRLGEQEYGTYESPSIHYEASVEISGAGDGDDVVEDLLRASSRTIQPFDQGTDESLVGIVETISPLDLTEVNAQMDQVTERRNTAALRRMVRAEMMKQMPQAIAGRVEEILKDQEGCPGRSRHWFSVKGWIGLRSPTCIHCGELNPWFSKADNVEWQHYLRTEGKGE